MQEFYINVLLSNLASLIKNEADNNLQIPAESANKHRYQSNRSFIIGCLKGLLPKILCSILKLTCIDRLYKETLRTKGKVLPGRSYPRKKLKLICRTHFNNKKVAFQFYSKSMTLKELLNEALLKCAFFKDFSLAFKFFVAFVISSF